MTKRIAILGGGIAGVTAAWQIAELARSGAPVAATLFESSSRFGGMVETVREQGFTIECGPDAWVTEKPWARDLVVELGLEGDLLHSNDETRKTHILLDGRLETMPDGMRMMVPRDLDAIDRSTLFTASAKRAFHDELTRTAELRDSAPDHDESIAAFTRRHFGEEVLTRIAAPLLSGVLGGDVEDLSVQAVMPQFVAMERSHGSLIAALQARSNRAPAPIFTTLRSGLGTLVDRLLEAIPPSWLRANRAVTSIARPSQGWVVRTDQGSENFASIFLAVPPDAARRLLEPLDPIAADLLRMRSSSAIIVALGYLDAPSVALPAGFGFLVPPSASPDQLLACTFADQKFDHRVPADGRLLRAFFGGETAEALLRPSPGHSAGASDEQISRLAQQQLTRILGSLPEPAFAVVRRWPQSLPQYAVGHLTRMARLDERVASLSGLVLLGNAYRGVGLPDLIRDARAAAQKFVRT